MHYTDKSEMSPEIMPHPKLEELPLQAIWIQPRELTSPALGR